MCKRSWTIKPILPDSLICDICKLILQVIITVLFLQSRFYHIIVSDLRVEVLSKPRLSRLIKVNSGCPLQEAAQVSEISTRTRQPLLPTQEDPLIGVFEKAPAMSLRDSPVNKQAVLINSTCTCPGRPHMNQYFVPQTEAVIGHSLQVESCISWNVNDHH